MGEAPSCPRSHLLNQTGHSQSPSVGVAGMEVCEKVVFWPSATDPLPSYLQDQVTTQQLYCLALCNRRDVPSLRSLTGEHLPLLRNIRAQAAKVRREIMDVNYWLPLRTLTLCMALGGLEPLRGSRQRAPHVCPLPAQLLPLPRPRHPRQVVGRRDLSGQGPPPGRHHRSVTDRQQ